MSSATGTDYYEILGVERAADERRIKQAYFKRVRQFSPENHPEEFKRLREAYEVLSSAKSRADYDALTSFGDEINLRMRSGTQAMERGDYKLAQAEFKHVLVLQPQLAFARDLLGMAYLNASQPREALVHFNQLVRDEPNSAVYHLHQGYAHYALDSYAPAIEAYQRATAIDPTDTRVLVALADCFAATQQYDDALRVLDKAIDLDGEVDFQDFVFLMRKVQIELLRHDWPGAERELDRIFQILPPDAETRKYVATRIMSLAADMFRMKRTVDGSKLLAQARRLDPDRKSLRLEFPTFVKLPLSELPAASVAALREMGKEWSATRLTHRPWSVPVLLVIGALVAALAAGGTLTMESEWQGGGVLWALATIVGAPLLALYAWQTVRRVARSPVGKFTIVHPLYLLQVNIDRLTAWPLANLQDVALTHHLRNGVYQYTAVRMLFDATSVTVSIGGEQQAVDWAQNLLDARDRMLGMMKVGVLDGDEAIDLIPPRLLDGKERAGDAVRRRASLKLYGGTAAAASLFFGVVGVPLNRHAAERADWARIERERSYSYDGAAREETYLCRQYLARHPRGPHAAEARHHVLARYDEAKATFLQRAAGAPGAAAVGAILDALRDLDGARAATADGSFEYSRYDAPTPAVPVVFASETAGGVRAGGAGAIEEALGASERAEREVDLVRRLSERLEEVVPGKLVHLERVPVESESGVPASLRIGYKLRSPGAGGGLAVDLSVAIVVGGKTLHHYETTWTGTRALLDASAADSDGAVYSGLFDSALEALGAQLGAQLGVGWSERARPAAPAGDSPEDDLAEVQRRIDRMVEHDPALRAIYRDGHKR